MQISRIHPEAQICDRFSGYVTFHMGRDSDGGSWESGYDSHFINTDSLPIRLYDKVCFLWFQNDFRKIVKAEFPSISACTIYRGDDSRTLHTWQKPSVQHKQQEINPADNFSATFSTTQQHKSNDR